MVIGHGNPALWFGRSRPQSDNSQFLQTITSYKFYEGLIEYFCENYIQPNSVLIKPLSEAMLFHHSDLKRRFAFRLL
jgi:hypothetical protein